MVMSRISKGSTVNAEYIPVIGIFVYEYPLIAFEDDF